MEEQLFQALITNGGVGGFLIVTLFMIYKTGKFFAPLVTNYIQQQTVNQANIAKTLSELSELQKISNVRLEAIERQLTLFEGVIDR